MVSHHPQLRHAPCLLPFQQESEEIVSPDIWVGITQNLFKKHISTYFSVKQTTNYLVVSKKRTIFALKSIGNIVNTHLKIVELWKNLQAKKKK